MDHKINLDEVLKHMRDQIGVQAQEIAVLKATISTLENDSSTKS